MKTRFNGQLRDLIEKQAGEHQSAAALTQKRWDCDGARQGCSLGDGSVADRRWCSAPLARRFILNLLQCCS